MDLNDFSFLLPYINNETRITIRKKYDRMNKESIRSLNAINRVSLLDEINNSENNEDEEESSFNDSSKSNNFLLKEDYLLNNDESEGKLKLFGKLKMKDYSPFDLLRFEKQIKNFLILSFFWTITMLIKNGINLKSKYIQKFHEEMYWNVFNIILEIFSYFIVLLIFLKQKLDKEQPLIFYQIISFIVFLILLYIDFDKDEISNIILMFFGRFCWTSLFAIIFVITSIIYPIMIRTKGLGWNLAFGFLGVIIEIILTEYTDLKNDIKFFLIFIFFALVLSYGLPKKIGTFILESPSIMHHPEKEKKEEKEEILDD